MLSTVYPGMLTLMYSILSKIQSCVCVFALNAAFGTNKIVWFSTREQCDVSVSIVQGA